MSEWSEWIEWHGGSMPVAEAALVEAKLRSGYVPFGREACFLRWEHTGNDGDIVAYRIANFDQSEAVYVLSGDPRLGRNAGR